MTTAEQSLIDATDIIERIAERLWRAEALRATGRDRLVPWAEVNAKDQASYRFVATEIIQELLS